jgi:hypothetical protein
MLLDLATPPQEFPTTHYLHHLSLLHCCRIIKSPQLTMKLGSACLECRKGKRKCDKSTPGTTCEQCRRRGIHCSSLNRVTSGPATLIPRVSHLGEADPLMPSEQVRLELVDLYICYIHDKPHSLFHESSLKLAARDKTVSRAVLYGIFALSAR